MTLTQPHPAFEDHQILYLVEDEVKNLKARIILTKCLVTLFDKHFKILFCLRELHGRVIPLNRISLSREC